MSTRESKQVGGSPNNYKQIAEKGLKKPHTEVAQSCPTLFNPMDCRLLGSSAHGILQARILKWAAIPFSRGLFQPMD